MTNLLDSILTIIESHEAEQIQYGLYDILLTGNEVLAALAAEPEANVRAILSELWERGLIVRFDDNPNQRDWIFRSRMAETVRLVSKLRQRIVRDIGQTRSHRADRSPRLVHDLKFEIRPRHVPNRNLPMHEMVAPLRQGSPQKLLAEASGILEALFPSDQFNFSGFQQRAFAEITRHILVRPRYNDVRGLVVTANTGAGKTYAFFLPVLAYCLVEKGLRGQTGVKAICIYPRVALSENQLEDFVHLIYQANQYLPTESAITVGIDSSASPHRIGDFTKADDNTLKQVRGWRWEAQTVRYICPFARCPVVDCNGELAVSQKQPDCIFCTKCGAVHPFILYAKEQFSQNPPDVLIATTESLNSRLMDSSYQMLFGNANYPPPAVVMLDEIHLQSSTKGTQIAFLLRRLIARLRRGTDGWPNPPNLALVGLSATISQPKAFFSDLTGLTISAISVVEPDEEQEMIPIGAERYLFVRAGQEEDTAVISTLLQTAMVLVHTMPLPSPVEQAKGIMKYKTFGFAQSLDIVGRWYYQLADAEKINPDNKRVQTSFPPEQWPIEHTPLYMYRTPGHNRRLFPNFFGQNLGQSPCNCHQQGRPDPKCLYFQEGECWWVVNQGLADSMRLKRKAANDRQVTIEPVDDLIITTSALEVGYDDATIMGVIQYQAPTNIASFVQRKGRGGRTVGTRPIMATVFSPYKTTDVFLYQNHHLLVEPRFKKLPLNPTNIFLQRIHGFYALFDWLAYLASRQNLRLAFGDYMDSQDYATLKRLTTQTAVLDAFRDYIAGMFDLQDPARLQDLLVDPAAQTWSDTGILTNGLLRLMEALHQSYDQGANRRVRARQEVLRDYLPQNLFSDINLPELDVDYGVNRSPQAEDIVLGLTETIPGNVTFRGGGSSWIAPLLGPGQTFDLEDTYTASNDQRHVLVIQSADLPRRVTQLISGQGRLPRDFRTIRPVAVRLQRFGDRDGSYWWFDGETEPGHLKLVEPPQIQPQNVGIRQVGHASSAYPIGFTSVELPKQVGRRYAFDVRDRSSLFNDLGRALFSRIDFASDTDNGRLMKVRRVIIGSQYSLKLAGEDEPLEGVLTFTSRDARGELTGLGYEMQTEGITFILTDSSHHALTVSAETANRLRRNFVKHAAITELTTWSDINYFAAERFVEVMLSTLDTLTHLPGVNAWSLDKTINACQSGDKTLGLGFRAMVEQVYHLSRKNRDAVTSLYNRTEIRSLFADRYKEIHSNGPLYHHYLEDTFVHTLKHALKQTAQTLAGVEAMEYIAAYTLLNVDFGEIRDRPIWLYELGIGGVGVMRSVQETLRIEPDRFWHTLENIIQTCDTEAEDYFLLEVLAQPPDFLTWIHTQIEQIQTSPTSEQRQTTLRTLRQEICRRVGLLANRRQMRLLIKLFSDDYTAQGAGLHNWQFLFELNTNWIPDLSQRLGRLPTQIEACGMLHYELTHTNQAGQPSQRQQQARSKYPQLSRLLNLYQREYQGNQVRRVFENAVRRRLLLNCRDACPTCMDEGPGCQVDPPGLSSLTLSRALVRETLQVIRHPRQVRGTVGDRIIDLASRIEALFQQDPISPVVVAVPATQAEILANLISHLTDYGVADHLQRRYPRVVQARPVGAELHAWLSLGDGV